MKKVNKKTVTNYLLDNYGQIKHDAENMATAVNNTAKNYKLKPFDVFLLIVENKPIIGAYTHSYGFNTRYGRAIIESFKQNYYSL